MSHATASHPTPEALTAYGLGKLTDPETEVVARHLSTCADCRRLVEGLPADSLVGLVRSTKQATVLPAADPAHAPTGPGLGQSQLRSPAEPPLPPPADLPPELADHPRYRILRVLGRGGMGVVYEAEHRHMGRKVALKVVSQALVDRPEAVERFNREVHAAAQLIHPNIVTAFDAEQAGSLHLLVMEYVPGQSLAQVVEKKGPLPVVHACHFVRQAALGLQHASEQGMVHRDLKPHNLMVTPKGQVKILDFGLARLAAEKTVRPGLTAEDALMGTPEYLAPEQALDARQADVRADIYSLGCTLYCLLAGQPPFPDGTAMQKIMAHLEKQPRPLAEVRAEVPADLWAVVERMLAKDPTARYQKPVEVAQALLPFIKPGAKPSAGGVSAAPGVSAAGAGTVLGGDTSKVLKLRKEAAEKPPVPTAPAPDEPAAPFANLADAAARPMPAKKAPAMPKPAAAVWFRDWRVLTGAATAVLILGLVGLWAGGVLKVKTPQGTIILENVPDAAKVTVEGPTVTVAQDGKVVTVTAVSEGPYRLKVVQDGQEVWSSADLTVKLGGEPIRIRVPPPGPEDARVVLEIDQPGAELFVDEQKRTNAVPGDYKPVEIKVKPGRHKLRISKAGFEDFTQNVEFRSGKTESIRVRLKLAEDGFVSLFNGKDLTGWEGLGYWSVEDGAIVGSTQPGGVAFNTFLCSKQKYKDFELSFQVKLRGEWAKANSGVQIRSEITDREKFIVKGPQADMGQQFWGSLYGEASGGMMKAADPGLVARVLRWDDFNDYYIKCAGKHVTIKLNGETTVDDDFPNLPDEGIIAWQLHNGPPMEVSFKNIRFKDLSRGGAADGFVPLFNGKDLTGWKTPSERDDNWRVENGVLIGTNPTAANFSLCPTERDDFADFHLRVEARCSDGNFSVVRLPNYMVFINSNNQNSAKTGSLEAALTKWERVVTVREPPVPANQWFIMESIVRGTKIVVKVNGRTTANYAAPERRCERGNIALAVNKTGCVEFRKIEIKELPPTKSGQSTPEAAKVDEAWLKSVAGLSADEQVKAVAQKLRDLNPGFDGKVTPKVEGGVVIGLQLRADQVADLSPVRALTGLRTFECTGSGNNKGKLADLSPLKGLKLTSLNCYLTQVADLSPLQGMPLTSLVCGQTNVSDLSPLRGMPLKTLDMFVTPRVADLSPLKDMPLENLTCCFTQVADLSPLRGMKLRALNIHATRLTPAGLEPVLEMSSLRFVCLGGGKMGGEAMAQLAKLPGLEVLSFLDTRLTDAAFGDLKGMSRLRELWLRSAGVTNEALVHLKEVPSLRKVGLGASTRVTDAGLEYLAGLTNLAELDLTGTAVTDEGVAKLRAALPQCNIKR
jgi:hypothetical protein